MEQVQTRIQRQDALFIQKTVRLIRVSDEIKRYIVTLVGKTRTWPGVRLGVSTRGAIALMKMSQALSLLDNLPFVFPESVREVAVNVLVHRLLLDDDARFSGITGGKIIADILADTPVPS